MALIAHRGATRAAAAAALYHPYKLLAVATSSAGADGDGNRGVEILRLWRGVREPELRRHLQSVATLPSEADEFSSIAWSPAPCAKYPLGLLATGLADGVVHVWDPSKLTYDPEGKLEEAYMSYTLGVFTVRLHEDPTKLSYFACPGMSTSDTKFPKPNLDKKKANVALEMEKGLDSLQMEPIVTKTESAGKWNIVKKEEWSSIKEADWEDISNEVEKDGWEWDHVSKEESEETHLTGSVLKLEDLKGPVQGLAFNHYKTNLLAASGNGDQVMVYDIDKEFSGSYKVLLPKESQSTFLEWNAGYPSILALTDTDGATILDVRKKKPLSSLKYGAKKHSEVHWKTDDVYTVALSSDANPVKIYDLRSPIEPTHVFGPKQGVHTTAWSYSTDSSLLSIGTDGLVDIRKLNDKRSADRFSLNVPGNMEASSGCWCLADNVIAVSSTTGGISLCKFEPPW